MRSALLQSRGSKPVVESIKSPSNQCSTRPRERHRLIHSRSTKPIGVLRLEHTWSLFGVWGLIASWKSWWWLVRSGKPGLHRVIVPLTRMTSVQTWLTIAMTRATLSFTVAPADLFCQWLLSSYQPFLDLDFVLDLLDFARFCTLDTHLSRLYTQTVCLTPRTFGCCFFFQNVLNAFLNLLDAD